MTELEEQLKAPPQPKGSVGDVVDCLGTMLVGGLITLGVLGFCLTVSLSLWMVPSQESLSDRIALTALACLAAIAEVWSIYFAYRFFQGEPAPQFLVTLAQAQPRWPVLLRPVAAVWWLSHYVVAVVGLAILLREVEFPDVSTYVDYATYFLKFLMYLVGTACGNAFLMLGVGALFPGGRVLRGLHWARYAIDLLIAILLVSMF